MVGVEPAALDGNGIGVHVGRDHLKLAGPKRGELGDQILVTAAFLEQVANLLNILRLCETTDEGGVGLGQNLVVDVTDVLGRQHTRYAVLPCLFEDELDEVLRWGIAWMGREVRRHLIHEEQQLETKYCFWVSS